MGKKPVALGVAAGVLGIAMRRGRWLLAGLAVAALLTSAAHEGFAGAQTEPISEVVDVRDAVPVTCDWNGDGHLDLVVALRSGGIVVLETFSGLMDLRVIRATRLVEMTANTSPVPLRQFATVRTSRQTFDVCDWNGDGALDIAFFTTAGHLEVHLGLGDGMGAFAAAEPIAFSDGSALAFPACGLSREKPAVRVLDWNGDGALDLLVAVDECYILTSGESFPDFERPAYWSAAGWCGTEGPQRETGELFALSGYGVDPWGVDWDRDGRRDVVLSYQANLPSGTFGRVLLALNVGTDREPQFTKERSDSELFATDEGGRPIGSNGRVSVALCDADGDGWWDVLVGGPDALTLYRGDGTYRLREVWSLPQVHVGAD